MNPPTLPLERYAELLASVVDVLHDPRALTSRLYSQDLSADAWADNRTAWTAKLTDPAEGAALAPRFVALFDAALLARAQGAASAVAAPSAPQPSAPQPSVPQPSAPQPSAPQPSAPLPGAASPPVDQQVMQFGHEVGRGISAGVSALGGFFDSLSKAATAPSVGAVVMVQWSDGKRYRGKVLKLSPGQCEVEMDDASRHWVPTQYVTPA